MGSDEKISDNLNDAAVISAFKDKTKEMFHELGGMNSDTIEAFVKNHVQELINEFNLDVTIEDVVVSGSRCRGLETEGSDLDVVLYFSGNEREDSFFNLLHDNGFFMGDGVYVDINPKSVEQSGSLSEYLTDVEAYLAEKQAQIARETQQTVVQDEKSEPEVVVSYTVAECGEFHSQGAYHEGIATIEEAKAIYEAIPEEHRNMIPAVGINVHTQGTSEIDDTQWDFLYGNSIDLSSLGFLPDIAGNTEAMEKLEQMIAAFPDAEVIGNLPGREGMERQGADIDLDAVKPVYVDEAARLAAEFDRFSLDFNPEEYKDSVKNWETQVHNIADDIRSGNSADYKQYLGAVVEQSDNIEDVRKAAELMIKLAEYKPLAKVEELEEENLNQIDNVLSNTVPKAEERKEARNAEQEHIEEEERKRRTRGERPSLRARLAEKKAIVAAGGTSPQHERQRQAQCEAIASQRDI